MVRAFFFSMAHKRYEQGQFIGLDMNYVVKVLDIVEIEEKGVALESIIKLTDEFLFNQKDKKIDAF